tara:strand:- start:4773 stop:4952 length:180 start_codon:yes stop_codon:yes gene_type:complete
MFNNSFNYDNYDKYNYLANSSNILPKEIIYTNIYDRNKLEEIKNNLIKNEKKYIKKFKK